MPETHTDDIGELAGLGRRVVAFAIDTVGFAVVLAFLTVPFVFLLEGSDPGTLVAAAALFVLVVVVGFFGYRAVTEAILGYTVGKRLLGIRVVDEAGEAIGWPEAVIRNVVLVADNLPVAYLLGIAMILYNDDERRLGDMAAKTYVVAG